MPIAVGSTVQITFRSTWAGQRVMLTQNYNVSANASAGTIIQDLGTINGYFVLVGAGSFLANYQACLPNNVMIDTVRSQVLHPSRSIYYDTAIGMTGAHASPASIGNLQHSITLYSEFGGRNQIAVKKIGPAPDGTYLAGAPTAAYKDGPLTVFANELTQTQVTLAPAITLVPIVHHPLSPDDKIIGFRLPDKTGTMRSRSKGVGI